MIRSASINSPSCLSGVPIEETNCRERLLARLRVLAGRCGYRLRRLAAATRTITLQIAYTDNLLLDGGTRLARPVQDDEALFTAVRPLFRRVAHRRVRVRYQALSCADLCRTAVQLSLLPDSGAAARKFRYEATVGNVGINIGVAAPMAFFPFSGWKNSFFGDLHGQGRHAVEFFTQTKIVVERWPKEWSRKF